MKTSTDNHSNLPRLNTLLQDVKFSLRMLGKNPRFTAVAMLILALGIGACTAIFSLVSGVLLRPLNYSDPERLFTVREVVPQLSHLYPTLPVNAKHFTRWQEECSSCEDIAQADRQSFSLTGTGEPVQVSAGMVSWNFFQVLGTQPQAGRLFAQEEDQPGRDDVVVLTDRLWRRQFRGDPAILSNKVLLDGKPYVVIGILPASFRYPEVPSPERTTPPPEVFKPMGLNLSLVPELGDFNYDAIVRLRPGVTSEQALAELNSIQSAIASGLPGGIELRATMRPLKQAIVGSAGQDLILLFAAVGAILLIVCVNLANLLLARVKRRKRELAVRVALGATRGRIIQQLVTESLVLTLIGGGLGIVLAVWGVNILVRTAPVNLPRLSEVRLDWTVLLFALIVSTCSGLLVGILPALRLARTNLNEDLKTSGHAMEGRSGARMRKFLVGAEVSISLILVVMAGLLLMSFVRVLQVEPGFETKNILTLDVTLPATKYREDQNIDRFYTELLGKVKNLPGVESSGLVSTLPLQGESWVDAVTVEGDQRPITERPQANYRFVSPEYFEAVGIPLMMGRAFEERDRNTRAAVVSHSIAESLWPGRNPIGIKFKRSADSEPPFEIIGVIADIRGISLQQKPGPMVYVPYWERLRLGASLVVRTKMDPLVMAPAVRSAVWQVDNEVPISDVQTMEQLMTGSVSQRRFQLTLILLFAFSSLLLASIGIYGVVAESVTSRTNEIGIRMALGADGSKILWMVLREGMVPVVIGLIVGVIASRALGQVISSLLFEVEPQDLKMLVIAIVTMTIVAAAACYFPARKASKIDPLKALRFE